MHLLDTDILSDLMRRPQGPVRDRIAAVSAGEVCTSAIVACELRFGAVKSGSAALAERVETILAALPVLAFEPPADAAYGRLRATLEAAGTPIGAMDLLIAAQCVAGGHPLATRDVREFSRVEGLLVVDWQGDE